MNPRTKTCAIAGIAFAVLSAASSHADVGVLPPAADLAQSRLSVSSARFGHAGAHTQGPASLTRQHDAVLASRKHAGQGEQSPITVYRPARAASSHSAPPKTASVRPQSTLVASSRITGQQFAAMTAMPVVAVPDTAPRTSVTLNKNLHVGDTEIYDFNGIKTVAVGDPAIADIQALSTRQLLVNAKGIGTTTIFVFDKNGKNVMHVTVLPAVDMDAIAKRIEQEIGLSSVSARSVNGTVFLEGTVDNAAASSRAEAIATAYAPKVKNVIQVATTKASTVAETYAQLLTENLAGTGIIPKIIDDHTIALTGKYAPPVSPRFVTKTTTVYGDITETRVDPLTTMLNSLPAELKVINLINFTTKTPRQVMVRAKVVDINRNSTKNFGVQWGNINYTGIGTQNMTFTIDPQPFPFGQAPLPIGTTGSLLGGGKLTRLLPFAAQLNALINEGKARILSEPDLLVLDGNDASILVGGEIPIPISTGSGAGVTVSVTYKQFGIRLDVSPVIVANDKIQMTVTPEVSEIDKANSVIFGGFSIPGLVVRRATSTLQMNDGQTLVIGGLYSNTDNKSRERIPLLSDIPIIGEFFKSTSTSKIERELMIFIETEIVNDGTAGLKVPAPGSLENPNIRRPYVPRHEFDQDFPEIENLGKEDRDKPKNTINLPRASASDAH